jgi:hypothetical protein
MKAIEAPITVATSKPVTIKNATLKEKLLFDPRTIESRRRNLLEAFVVNENRHA